MSTDTTYNGWRNIETWRVQLHLANDEFAQSTLNAAAHVCIDSPMAYRLARERGGMVPWCDDGSSFADVVRKWFADRVLGFPTENTWDQFRGDVVEAALARVDWEEIATHWLADARHEVEQEGRA